MDCLTVDLMLTGKNKQQKCGIEHAVHELRASFAQQETSYTRLNETKLLWKEDNTRGHTLPIYRISTLPLISLLSKEVVMLKTYADDDNAAGSYSLRALLII